VRDRAELVEKNHPELSVRKQCELLRIARSTVDYQAVPENPEDIRIKVSAQRMGVGRFWWSEHT
jgi:hypothetical protein